MPSSILPISSAALSMRFKQPFTSEGLNTKHVTSAPGIYRGFRLGTSGSALSVTFNPDPETGDNLAVFHDSAGHALSITLTGAATLNLATYANRTVALAIFAQYSTVSFTAGEIRAYEVSPTDEIGVVSERNQLIVLGTVAVPASGLIPAANISNRLRKYAGNNESPQKAARVPVIQDVYFSQGDVVDHAIPVAVSAETGQLAITPGWTAIYPDATTDARWSVASAPTKTGGKVVVLSAVTPTGVATINGRLRSDIWIALGSVALDNWIDIAIEYEVVTVPTGALTFKIGLDDGTPTGPYTKSFTLATSSTGVKRFDTSVRASTVESSTLTTPVDPCHLMYAEFIAAFTGVVSGATYIRFRSCQVTISSTRHEDGNAEPDPRARRLGGNVGVRFLRFLREQTDADEYGLARPYQGGLALYARKSDTTAELLLTGPDGVQGTQGLAVGGKFEAGASGAMDDVTPRLRTKHTTASLNYSLVFESVKNTGTGIRYRIWAGGSDTMVISLNAKFASGNWTKDTNGVSAQAIRIATDGVSILNQVDATNTWTDAQWSTGVVSGGGGDLAVGPLTALWADGTSVGSQGLLNVLNEMITDLAVTSGTYGAGKISMGARGSWADGTANTASTLSAALSKIISDLTSTSGERGAGKITAPGLSAWADGTGNPANNLAQVLNKMIFDLTSLSGDRGAGKLTAPARASWADGTANPASTVAQALAKIVTDLTSADALRGAGKISGPAISSSPSSLAAGTLANQLFQLLTLTNQRGRLAGETAWTGNHINNGKYTSLGFKADGGADTDAPFASNGDLVASGRVWAGTYLHAREYVNSSSYRYNSGRPYTAMVDILSAPSITNVNGNPIEGCVLGSGSGRIGWSAISSVSMLVIDLTKYLCHDGTLTAVGAVGLRGVAPAAAFRIQLVSHDALTGALTSLSATVNDNGANEATISGLNIPIVKGATSYWLLWGPGSAAGALFSVVLTGRAAGPDWNMGT